jgi:CDP-diacylglycerol--glycerol-3-phosphate 3-phosphatidyltransferase
MFFNLPTLLTWGRIVSIPLVVGVYYLHLEPATQNILGTALFIIVALTDWADGYLARRLKMTSSFGAFLDPVADKFLICAALLVLVHLHRLHAVIALIIIGARSRSRRCASGWRRSARRAASPCTWSAKSRPSSR